MPKLSQLLFATFLYSLAHLVIAEETLNYCHDPDVKADWERLLHKHEGNEFVGYLYNLRNTLCQDVEEGRVSLKEATERFERERDRVIQLWREQLERRHDTQTGVG